MTSPVDRTERFLIIGAGPLGLAMAWELRRRRLRFDHVEARAEVGGVWVDGVYPIVRTISPRSMCQYPARPLPTDSSLYLSLDEVRGYLNDFAREERLTADIAFNTRVELATPEPDETWRVAFADGRVVRYRGVVSCIGHCWDPSWPDLAGEFSGTLLHSSQYHDRAQLASQRVLVIGLGQSGADLAMEASRHGACAHLSVRRGKYLLPRNVGGRPYMEVFPGWAPAAAQRAHVRRTYARYVPDAANLGLPPPALPPLEEHNLCWTDELPDALRSGRVVLRSGVRHLDGDHVIFTDGRRGAYDVIICATGFHMSFPFLPPNFVPMTKAKTPRLFLGGVLPGYRHLYIAGSLEGILGFGGAGAMNSRLVADLIAAQERLPVPLGSIAAWLKYSHHRTPTTSLGRMRLMRHFIAFWLAVARFAMRLNRARWTARHARELPAWLARARPAAPATDNTTASVSAA